MRYKKQIAQTLGLVSLLTMFGCSDVREESGSLVYEPMRITQLECVPAVDNTALAIATDNYALMAMNHNGYTNVTMQNENVTFTFHHPNLENSLLGNEVTVGYNPVFKNKYQDINDDGQKEIVEQKLKGFYVHSVDGLVINEALNF